MGLAGSWFRRKPELFISVPQTEDMASLARIHAEGFARPWSGFEIAALARGKGAAIWVASEEGRFGRRLDGFVLLRQAADEAEIITIATARDRRRNGVARALMEHAIRELQRDRIRRLYLEVSETNRAAIALYEGLGFKRVGRRDAYYAGDGRPDNATAALVMARDLG